MQTQDFSYYLPPERIAQHPPTERGNAKLLVLHKTSGQITHKAYRDLIDYLEPGDLLVLNNTKVIKARLFPKNSEGIMRELLLLERHHDLDPHRVKAIHRGKLRVGEILNLYKHQLRVEVVNPDGTVVITSTSNLYELAESQGHVPLPPYMKRQDSQLDENRYQTIFAQEAGSVAAPTASLNLTGELLDKIQAKGVNVAYLTLHVGYGTFMPIKTDDPSSHSMHSEYFEIPLDTVKHIQKTKAAGKKITAVGTTVTRTLEFTADKLINASNSLSGEANIFIYPGYEFKIVDQLLTNFHAPRSTVLMMAAAFAGWENLQGAYSEALAQDYSFLSYGDSMLIC